MKQIIAKLFSLFIISILLTSMVIPTSSIPKQNTQKAFNDFFTKRSFVYSSISDLEKTFHTKFNFLQRLEIRQAQKRIAKKLKKENLLNECDQINLINGDSINAIITEIGPSEIKFKKCDNKTGPTYILKKSVVQSIKYANGSTDSFGNKNNAVSENEVDSDLVKTDPMAIASMVAGLSGIFFILLSSIIPVISGISVFGLLLSVFGIISGFISYANIKKSKGKLKGKGFATTGIISGFVLIGLSLLFLLLAILFLLATIP
jgi:hypothetical protein